MYLWLDTIWMFSENAQGISEGRMEDGTKI